MVNYVLSLAPVEVLQVPSYLKLTNPYDIAGVILFYKHLL